MCDGYDDLHMEKKRKENRDRRYGDFWGVICMAFFFGWVFVNLDGWLI